MVVLDIQGTGARGLDQEAGVHRLQRVPPTEKKGRVHSSTVSVVVLNPAAPAPSWPEDRRAPQDFVLEWYSGSGAGGQHRNKHQNSARITHTPTGLMRTAQTRSRANSQQSAMDALLAELQAMSARRGQASLQGERARQVGQSERADRRRLWAFQRDEVVDFQTGRRLRCRDALRGALDGLWSE
jgi:peptide chain release factor 1